MQVVEMTTDNGESYSRHIPECPEDLPWFESEDDKRRLIGLWHDLWREKKLIRGEIERRCPDGVTRYCLLGVMMVARVRWAWTELSREGEQALVEANNEGPLGHDPGTPITPQAFVNVLTLLHMAPVARTTTQSPADIVAADPKPDEPDEPTR